jgi:hypothetical protein
MRPHAQRQEDSTVRNLLLEGGLLGLFLVGSGLVGKGCSMARVIPSYDSGRSYLVRGSSRRVVKRVEMPYCLSICPVYPSPTNFS